jgi:hypothetical protein
MRFIEILHEVLNESIKKKASPMGLYMNKWIT